MKKINRRILLALSPVLLLSATNADARNISGTNLMNQVEQSSSFGKELHFMENVGQITDGHNMPRADVQFKMSGHGMTVFVSKNGLHYQWNKTNAINKEAGSIDATTYRMDVQLVGASMAGAVIKEAKQSYFEQYYFTQFGNEGAIANAYDKVTFSNVYPNIDWVLYIKGGAVEYDFVVHPGGNVADIKLKYDGATALQADKDGGIIATTPMGTVAEQAPYSYQADGSKIASKFILDGNTLAFATASHKGTLTIDPTLKWGTYYGDISDDFGEGVAYDKQGQNVYLAGYTSSTDNIATSNGFLNTFAGGLDAFLVKFDSAGHRKWATFYGGTRNTLGTSVACDNNGNVYLAGYTNSTSGISGAITGSTVFQAAYAVPKTGTANDGFVVKIDSAGHRVWGTYYGGGTGGSPVGEDRIWGVAYDGFNGLYIVGTTAGAGLSTTNGAQPTIGGGNDALLVKFDTSGRRIWATYYGGTSTDEGRSVACAIKGNVVITGWTSSSTAISNNGFQNAIGGGTDAYIARFDSAGHRRWGSYFGGSDEDWGKGIACDDTGNIFLVGETVSDGLSTSGSFQPLNLTNDDAYLLKVDSAGNKKWATYYGTDQPDGGFAVKCDHLGGAYIAGYTYGRRGLSTAGGIKDSGDFSPEVFLARFDADGGRTWGTLYGGSDQDGGTGQGFMNDFGMAFDGVANLYIGGATASTDGIKTTGAFQEVKSDSWDGFLARVFDCATVPMPGAISGSIHVCAGNTETYSVVPVSGAISYTWTLPNGWTGTSVTNSITVTTGSAGGGITVAANSPCAKSAVQTLTVSVNTAVTPAVDIVAVPGNTICAGTSVQFTATPTNGGSTPVYTWFKNNMVVTGVGATYTDAALNNNDAIKCVMTTSASCALVPTDTSSIITMVVNPLLTPVVTIAIAPNDTFCAGTTATFTATATDAGSTPVYTWLKNGATVTSTGNSYTDAGLNDQDTVKCIVTSNAGCAAIANDTSDGIVVTVDSLLTPRVNITVEPGNTISEGTEVTYAAIPVNGGTATTYQWYINGVPVAGATDSTYVSDTVKDADFVTCIIHSNEKCTTHDTALSNEIEMTVTLGVANVAFGSQVSVYPNPAQNIVYINAPIAIDAAIISMDGKIIMQQQKAKQLDISKLADGIYNIRITDANGTLVKMQKLVKITR